MKYEEYAESIQKCTKECNSERYVALYVYNWYAITMYRVL